MFNFFIQLMPQSEKTTVTYLSFHKKRFARRNFICNAAYYIVITLRFAQIFVDFIQKFFVAPVLSTSSVHWKKPHWLSRGLAQQ